MSFSSNSIILNAKRLASYSLVYSVNYLDSIRQLSDLCSKEQVRVKQFESFYQQTNLVHIDMLFPNVLADMALDVFFGKVFTFYDYIQQPKTYQLFDKERDINYFNVKIPQFIDYLLYSDIAKMDYSSGELTHDMDYTIQSGEIQLHFNAQNYTDLIQIAVSTLVLRIDLNKSYVTTSNELVLCFVIAF